jgi:hypothetical protein
MKKIFKISVWIVLSFLVLILVGVSLFVYKVKNGFPVSYETEIPKINFPAGKKAVLLFSKTTGYRHGESIVVSKIAFEEMAAANGWFLYQTEEGGVFNPEQLEKFDAVIFNNSTGRVLNDEQQKHLEKYVENGGKLIGIHGSGDDSHHWNWYNQNLLGAKFSHHPLNPQLQEAEVSLGEGLDSALSKGLTQRWTHTDEWYVFFENPDVNGFQILYTIDGEKIFPDGNLLWIKDKDFGMGEAHPVAWYRTIGTGKTFYTSIGHDQKAWLQKPFLQLLENAVEW